jgi:hypothetical protein
LEVKLDWITCATGCVLFVRSMQNKTSLLLGPHSTKLVVEQNF